MGAVDELRQLAAQRMAQEKQGDSLYFGIPTRPPCGPNVAEIARNQVQDLVPVKGVEVRVLSSAIRQHWGYGR